MYLKRQHKRYEIDFMEIAGKMMLAKYVKILDMSVGGIAILTDKKLNVGEEYEITIEGKGRILNLKGVVAWSSLMKTIRDTESNIVPIYKVGMKFLHISDEMMHEIENVLKDHRRDSDRQIDLFKLNGLRLHVRIRIKDPEKTTLNLRENYSVKNLSLGGMLIVSQFAVELDSKLPMELVLNGDKTINFLGRVVSCRLIQKEGCELYYIGIEFLDMSEKDSSLLSDIINSLDSMNNRSSSLQT